MVTHVRVIHLDLKVLKVVRHAVVEQDRRGPLHIAFTLPHEPVVEDLAPGRLCHGIKPEHTPHAHSHSHRGAREKSAGEREIIYGGRIRVNIRLK